MTATLKRLEGKRFEIEYLMYCEQNEEDPAIQVFMDFFRRELRFYVNHFLPDEKVNYVLEKKTTPQSPEEKYTITLKCPICGEWEHEYINIPNHWKSRIAPHSLSLGYIPEKLMVKFDASLEAEN